MTRLDVVAELAAHQQNVTPDDVAPRAVVIALPLPALATLVPWFAQARAAELRTLADELGGGDGPLAIVTLEGRERVEERDARGGFDPRDGLDGSDGHDRLDGRDPALDDVLAAWAGRVARVVVHGARDQPGFARAVSYRWPGTWHRLDVAVLDAVFEPAAPRVMLAPGVVRVAPGVPAPRDAACVLAAVADDDDPRRVADQGAHVWPYAIDRARRLGPWSGMLPASARLGTADGAAIRARWDAHWTARGRPDVVRSAVLGLDPVLEAALRGTGEAPAPAVALRGSGETPATARCARLIAITGIDGSGKSSHAARLAETLRARGARTRVIKLYRQGAFLELANLLGARTRRGAPLSAFRTSRVIKLIDSLWVWRDHLAPALADCDAVIADRYVETHLAAASAQLGWDLTGHALLRPFPPPDLACWLALDPDVALARREARGEPASADEHAIGLRGYAEAFGRLAHGAVRLDATADGDGNARVIADRAAAIVPAASTPAAALPGPGPAPERAPERAGPRAVHLGGAPAGLGHRVLALRGELAGWCAGSADLPVELWLEAYAAQLVIDLWTGAPGDAIALWPDALAAMPDHGLDMVVELGRVLAPLVEVCSYDPRPASYQATFRALGATDLAARRLAQDYATELARLARAAGWPASAA